MRTVLLALVLTLTLASSSMAQEGGLIGFYDAMKQQESAVEQHPRAGQPIETTELDLGPIPPYFAKRYLRGEQYSQWALLWNAYQEEVVQRSYRQRVVYGTTVTTNKTTNGTTVTTTPRFWVFPEGTPGVIKYNPFVPPKK